MTEVSLHGATKLNIKTYGLDSGTQVARLIVSNDEGEALEITLYVKEGKSLQLALGSEE